MDEPPPASAFASLLTRVITQVDTRFLSESASGAWASSGLRRAPPISCQPLKPHLRTPTCPAGRSAPALPSRWWRNSGATGTGTRPTMAAAVWGQVPARKLPLGRMRGEGRGEPPHPPGVTPLPSPHPASPIPPSGKCRRHPSGAEAGELRGGGGGVAPLGGGRGLTGALLSPPLPSPPSPGAGAGGGSGGVGSVVSRSAPARLSPRGGGGRNGRNGLNGHLRPRGERDGGGGSSAAGTGRGGGGGSGEGRWKPG